VQVELVHKYVADLLVHFTCDGVEWMTPCCPYSSYEAGQ
jgi:hypothetical protein